jgi:hypothetical protein
MGLSYSAQVTSECYLTSLGQLGAQTAFWLRITPSLVFWMPAWGKGLYDTDLRLYTMLWANCYFLPYAVAWWLSRDVTRQAPPHPACESVTDSMPCSEAALLSCYLLMTFAHQVVLRCPTRWLPLTWTLVLSLLVCVSLALNGQYSLDQLMAGLGLGLLCGLVASYLIYVHVMPRVGLMLGETGDFVFKHTGYLAVPRRFDADAWSFY